MILKMRALSFVMILGTSLTLPSHGKIQFAVDERGFDACYSSFLSQVGPGISIDSSAFEALTCAMEEKGNVLQKMAARQNQNVVLNPRNRKVFMDNMQGKGAARKRARVEDAHFQPVKRTFEEEAPAVEATARKRAWRVRYEEKCVAPVAKLLDRQDAMDVIEELFTPAPRNITFLVAHVDAHIAKEAAQPEAPRALKRQNADVATFFAPSKKRKADDVAPIVDAPSLTTVNSLVKSRISFWENFTK